MLEPELPRNEAGRLKTLQDLNILDTLEEERFDRLTRIAQRSFGVEIALVSLVDEERQWFKSRQGVDVCETGRSISFCGHAILGDDILEVPDAQQDPRFHDNPLVSGPPHIRFYAGAPLRVGQGIRVGTLCLIDSRPGKLSDEERRELRDLADCVERELQLVYERQSAQAYQSGEALVDSDAILEAMPDSAVIVDQHGCILATQGQLPLSLFKQKGIGNSLFDALPKAQADVVRAAFRSARYSNRVARCEIGVTVANEPLDIEVRVQPIRGHEVLLLMRNVTEERARARALEASQARLALVLEGTQIGTWEWNVQTGETVFNERWAEIVGYRLEELQPVSIDTWTSLAHPDDLAASNALLERHFKGELAGYDCRCRMRHKEGHWVWVHDRGRVMQWSEDGRPLKMYGTHADVTEEMTAQQATASLVRALTTLNEIASTPTLSVSEQIERALALGTRLLELDVGIVSHIFEQVYQIEWFHAPAEAGLESEQRFELGSTYCALTLEHGDVLAIDNMKRSAHAGHPCYSAFGLEAYIGAAIEAGGNLYGTLNFSSSHKREVPFSEAERMFVRLLARWVGAAIERSESKQRLTKLATQFPGMMYQFQLWPDGQITCPYASAGSVGIYGMTPEELEKDATGVFEVIHPDDIEYVKETIEKSVREMSVWHAQYRVLHRGRAETIWVEGHSTPERLGDGSVIWHGIIHDISQQKQAEEALRISESRLRALFELSPTGIALTELETGQFIEVNDALVNMSGYTRDELLSMTNWAVTPREYRDQQLVQIQRLREQGRYGPFEKDYARKDGTRFPAVLNGMMVSDLSGRQLVWSIVEDVTERKRAERLKNEFVSTVSHELRTPLTSISGALGLAVSGKLGEMADPIRNMLTIAHKNSKRLSYLINDLLDMDKLLSGNMSLAITDADVNDLVAHSLDNIRAYADHYGVKLDFQKGAASPIVQVDTQRFEQIMANLLSNAIKFSPKNSTVEVTVAPRGRQVRISVRDAGPGIPKEFHDRIFQKFAQADASDSRKKGGTGLGLAITRELVHRMEGDIGFDSKEGEGSCFYVDLPSPVAAEDADALGASVLVVEDCSKTASHLEAALERSGYDVTVSPNAEDALVQVRSHHFDLVVIDLKLNGTHGLELIRQIRVMPEHHSLPLLAISAELGDDQEFLSKCFPDVSWLAKPVDDAAFSRLVKDMITRASSERPRVLHVEDDVELHEVLKSLIGEGAVFELARSCGEAVTRLQTEDYDMVILDIGLPDGNGLDLVPMIKERLPAARIGVMTGNKLDRSVLQGVDAVMPKSELSINELLRIIEVSAQKRA